MDAPRPSPGPPAARLSTSPRSGGAAGNAAHPGPEEVVRRRYLEDEGRQGRALISSEPLRSRPSPAQLQRNASRVPVRSPPGAREGGHSQASSLSEVPAERHGKQPPSPEMATRGVSASPQKGRRGGTRGTRVPRTPAGPALRLSHRQRSGHLGADPRLGGGD